jgi:hypothetical protein
VKGVRERAGGRPSTRMWFSTLETATQLILRANFNSTPSFFPHIIIVYIPHGNLCFFTINTISANK